MISHKFKCIFVHVPKVAGQSIELFFIKKHGLTWDKRAPLLLRENDNPELGPPRLAHLRLYDYLDYQYISQDLFNNYHKFSFVRNPWSRAVSFYKYGNFSEKMTFRSFVTTRLPDLIESGHFFYKPQFDFLYKDNHTDIDFVGRFENLNEDFLKLLHNLNLPENKLPYRNETVEKGKIKKNIIIRTKNVIKNPKIIFEPKGDLINSKNYKDYYSNDLIDIIGTLYKEDVEAFGYEIN